MNPLYLAWQDTWDVRNWYPIGRLDADASGYTFRYVEGAARAKRETGFPLLLEFPDADREYRSPILFPTFRNRVMSEKRPDYRDYVNRLGLSGTPNPMQILSVSGGRRVTDVLEVFPKIERRADGDFTHRFFLRCTRRVDACVWDRLERLNEGDSLRVVFEVSDYPSVQIQTEGYHAIGWVPRYLANELLSASPFKPTYAARVVQINPIPAPSDMRVLMELTGCWADYAPMSSGDFNPLSPDSLMTARMPTQR